MLLILQGCSGVLKAADEQTPAILGEAPSAPRPSGTPSLWELVDSDNSASGGTREYPDDFDPTAVLLARVRVPAALEAGTPVPVGQFTSAAWANPQAIINNLVRNFVIAPAGALRPGVSLNL